MGRLDQAGAVARAVFDRLAFLAESLAVALALLVVFALAATRFDVGASAHVWGLFWLRMAEVDPAVRTPILALLGLVLLALGIAVAFVRWPKASRAFDAFPPSRRAQRKMLERLG